MPFSTYLEQKLLSHFLGIAAFTAPAARYASAHTANPGGTGASESGMARQALTFSTAPSGSAPAIANPTAAVVFTNSTGSTITVTHVGMWDAATGGNFLCYGQLSSSQSVPASATLTIAATDYDVTLT